MERGNCGIFLSLGSNEGNRPGMLKQACDLIEQRVGAIQKRSSVYETEPWGMEGAEPFLNQVIKVTSALLPVELLGVLQEIERELGRYQMPDGRCRIINQEIRHPASGIYFSRPIDLDILFYGKVTVNSPKLVIPHPLMAQRRFILVPLAEIDAEFQHPKLHLPINDLLASCQDRRNVKLLTK